MSDGIGQVGGNETAIFAAGCFWGVEHQFSLIPGVVGTEVGYTGGETPDPTYEQVRSGRTGHAEAVRITFDPSIVGYGELVRRFFAMHDPTQVGGQGPDEGSQYRSVVFYLDPGQLDTASRIMDELRDSGIYRKPLTTRLEPAGRFFRAEEHHQEYVKKHGMACSR